MSTSFKPSALSTLSAALLAVFASLAATPASAETDDNGAPATELERVTITQGRGQLRSVQGLTASDFEAAVPGTSPLLTVSRLPGVNFQSADSLGNYEWSTRITVRSFSQNQLGFTLDDVPLGDMSYGNANGLHISRAISSENVSRAYLSQGTGALETASSSNLGGTLQFYSSDPQKKFGVQLAQTLGSDSNRRTFLRVDTGESDLGSFYVSYTNQNADKWKGEGEQRLEQWNLKYVKNFGDSKLSAFVNTSKRREVDYQDMSLAMIKRLGKDWDNFYPDYAAALNAAKTLCGNNGTTYVAQCDDAYYAGAGLRDDQLAGVTLDAKLSEQVRLKTTAYYHHDKGMGLWFTPYPPAPTAPILSVRTTEYGIHREGVVSTLEYELGAHLIKAAFWFENNNFDQARRFYDATSTVPSVYEFPSNPYFTQWQYGFNTKTTQFSLADTWTVAKDLTVGFGFKSLRAKTEGDLQAGTGLPDGDITASKGFLPQVGVNYQLSSSDELFAGAARNMRAYQAAATGGPYSTTAVGFDAIKGTLKPETSDSFEAGWRSQTNVYQSSLTGYLVNFHNRQLAVQQGSGIQGNPSVLSNVGGVRSIGLEAALSLRLASTVTWYQSLSQSRSTYQDDVVNNGVTVATKGKHVVDAPDTMYKTNLGYDNGQIFGSIGADYMSKRYYTYLNDASVPNRTLLNLSGGVRTKSLGFISEGTLQFGVNNLTNKTYISTVGSNGFTNSDPNGTAQTLLVGSPRQFFITLSGKL